MPIAKYTNDQLRDHFERWLDIKERLPFGFVQQVGKMYPQFTPAKIKNVAYGRQFDFEMLQILEEVVKNKMISFQKRHKIRIGSPGERRK